MLAEKLHIQLIYGMNINSGLFINTIMGYKGTNLKLYIKMPI